MESARVRGTHLPPEESRRKQPGKGAAGSQTVVETVSHSLALSLLYNPCTFISLCVHLFRAIYGKSRWYAYRCVISVVTGISRHLAPSPVDVSEQQSETNVYLPLHPQPIWCRTYLSFVFCVVLKSYSYHWYLLLTTKFMFQSFFPNRYKIMNFYLLKNVLTITRQNDMHYLSWFFDIFQVWHLMLQAFL